MTEFAAIKQPCDTPAVSPGQKHPLRVQAQGTQAHKDPVSLQMAENDPSAGGARGTVVHLYFA